MFFFTVVLSLFYRCFPIFGCIFYIKSKKNANGGLDPKPPPKWKNPPLCLIFFLKTSLITSFYTIAPMDYGTQPNRINSYIILAILEAILYLFLPFIIHYLIWQYLNNIFLEAMYTC